MMPCQQLCVQQERLNLAAVGCLSRCVMHFSLYAHSHVIVFNCISQLKEANEAALKLMQKMLRMPINSIG